MRLSSNGTKAVLVDRLENLGIETKQEVDIQAHKFDTEGHIKQA